MRPKGQVLVPLEEAILAIGLYLHQTGEREFYGFQIARMLAEAEGARNLIGRGTLYKALDRLRRAGFVTAQWESSVVADRAGRPRRKFYQVTPAGAKALATSRAAQ